MINILHFGADGFKCFYIVRKFCLAHCIQNFDKCFKLCVYKPPQRCYNVIIASRYLINSYTALSFPGIEKSFNALISFVKTFFIFVKPLVRSLYFSMASFISFLPVFIATITVCL